MQLKLKSPDVISYLFRTILKFLLKGVLKLDDGFIKSFKIQVIVASEGNHLVRDCIEYRNWFSYQYWGSQGQSWWKQTKFVPISRMWEIENTGLSILRCLRWSSPKHHIQWNLQRYLNHFLPSVVNIPGPNIIWFPLPNFSLVRNKSENMLTG